MSGVWGGRVGQVDNGYKDWWRTVVSRGKDKDTGGICVKVVEGGLRTGWHRACVGEKIKLWSVGLGLKRHWKPGCYWLCVGKRVQTQSWEYGEVIEGHNFGRWRRHHRRAVFTGEVAMRTSTVKEMDEDLGGNVSAWRKIYLLSFQQRLVYVVWRHCVCPEASLHWHVHLAGALTTDSTLCLYALTQTWASSHEGLGTSWKDKSVCKTCRGRFSRRILHDSWSF